MPMPRLRWLAAAAYQTQRQCLQLHPTCKYFAVAAKTGVLQPGSHLGGVALFLASHNRQTALVAMDALFQAQRDAEGDEEWRGM